MFCPQCGRELPATEERCPACGTQLPRPSPPPAAATGAPTSAGQTATASGFTAPSGGTETRLPLSSGGPLAVGQAFGPRYHIIRLLGAGGMGAVYQAWDQELGVAVALKVIRPEVMADPEAARDLERRFKRELLLARQVSHKNVVRIHDIGEIDGIKYLTMTYIQGADLASILRKKGRVPVAWALQIAKQVGAGLSAAHEVGVVHRDLKPANVMIDAEDRAVIMDFGIARSVKTGAGVTAATAAGAIVGTIEYMAPEQAMGKFVDRRADLYAFGLMLYDLLVGSRHLTGGESTMGDLMRRMQQAPRSARSLNGDVPEALDRIITQCVQPDPAARYQTATELVADLDRLDAGGQLVQPAVAPPARRWPAVAAVGAATLLLVVAAAGGAWWMTRSRGSPSPATAQRQTVSVLIADFANRTNDRVFDGSLEQALTIAVEGASFVTSYPRATALGIATQIKPSSKLDESMGRLVAVREGINVILAGSIETAGSGYTITVRAVDPAVEQKVLATVTAKASTKPEVLQAMGTVAAKIRTALGDATPESAKLAEAETFTAASLEAVRDYSVAQDLAENNKEEEAIAYYKRAVEQDPNFGRAYSGWAVSAFTLGRQDEATTNWNKALSLMDRMTDREKYRTLGTYYLGVARNYDKAIENYSTLVKLYPADRGHGNLALAYFYIRDFPKALEEGRRAVELYPKSVRFRTNNALYAMYAGDFATAAAEGGRVIDQAPHSETAYLPLAMAALATAKPAEARDAYMRMARAGTPGASLANIGLADLAMYEAGFVEAEATLKVGIVDDEKIRSTAGMAAKSVALAEAYDAQGKIALAVTSAQRALKISRQESVAVPAARALLAGGKEADAKALAVELGAQLQPQSRAYGKIIEGEIALRRRRATDAVDAFSEARRLADVWLARFDLGIAYVEAGHHAEALAELETCQKRRGEATAIFLDDVPTFRYLAPLPYWLGRAQEGLGMKPAADEHYKQFLALRPEPSEDPLAADARKRITGR